MSIRQKLFSWWSHYDVTNVDRVRKQKNTLCFMYVQCIVWVDLYAFYSNNLFFLFVFFSLLSFQTLIKLFYWGESVKSNTTIDRFPKTAWTVKCFSLSFVSILIFLFLKRNKKLTQGALQSTISENLNSSWPILRHNAWCFNRACSCSLSSALHRSRRNDAKPRHVMMRNHSPRLVGIAEVIFLDVFCSSLLN